MASSLFRKDMGHKEVGVVELFLFADIGATGAVTMDSDRSKGIASITRNDTGDYTIQLSEVYNSLLMCDVMLLEADDTDLTHQVISQAVSNATPTVKIGFHAAATPTDPPDGSDIYVRITLKNSSV
jgi:hypothetical protein